MSVNWTFKFLSLFKSLSLFLPSKTINPLKRGIYKAIITALMELVFKANLWRHQSKMADTQRDPRLKRFYFFKYLFLFRFPRTV